jgi:hypothetical protein
LHSLFSTSRERPDWSERQAADFEEVIQANRADMVRSLEEQNFVSIDSVLPMEIEDILRGGGKLYFEDGDTVIELGTTSLRAEEKLKNHPDSIALTFSTIISQIKMVRKSEVVAKEKEQQENRERMARRGRKVIIRDKS